MCTQQVTPKDLKVWIKNVFPVLVKGTRALLQPVRSAHNLKQNTVYVQYVRLQVAIHFF